MNSQATEDQPENQADQKTNPDTSNKPPTNSVLVARENLSSVNRDNQTAGDSTEIQNVARGNPEASLIDGFLTSVGAGNLTRDELLGALCCENERDAAMLSNPGRALQWADQLLAQKTEKLARLDREREQLLAQCDRARRDIDLACDTMTARLDNQCNELNARTMSAKDAQTTIFAQKRAELQQQLDEMNMYQELASQLLNPSRSSAEVMQYAPTLINSLRASWSEAREGEPNMEVPVFEFVPAANVTGVNLLGELVMSEHVADDRSRDVQE